jgi:hypothetical protein
MTAVAPAITCAASGPALLVAGIVRIGDVGPRDIATGVAVSPGATVSPGFAVGVSSLIGVTVAIVGSHVCM